MSYHMYMEQDSTIVALRDLTKFIGTKQEASLPEETWKVLSQLLESNEKNTSVLSKSKRNKINSIVNSILYEVENSYIQRYSTRIFKYLVRLCIHFGTKNRKFLILKGYFSKLQAVEDEESLIYNLIDQMINLQDWKLVYLACSLVGSSTHIRLAASKYILKSYISGEIGKIIYSNIMDFTFQNYIIEFAGIVLPERKITVGDSFVSRLWDKSSNIVPDSLWVEFPFQVLAGQRRVIDYIKTSSRLYTLNHHAKKRRPENFLTLKKIEIQGRVFSYNDDNHIIIQVKGPQLFIWYPQSGSTHGLHLVEINLESLDYSPTENETGINDNIVLDLSSKNKCEFAATDSHTVWEEFQVKLYIQSDEIKRSILQSIDSVLPTRVTAKMFSVTKDLISVSNDGVRVIPTVETEMATQNSTTPQSDTRSIKEFLTLSSSPINRKSDDYSYHNPTSSPPSSDSQPHKRRKSEHRSIPVQTNEQQRSTPFSPQKAITFTKDETTVVDTSQQTTSVHHESKAIAQRSELQPYNPSILEIQDDLEELNYQIYCCLKSTTRQLSKRLSRIQQRVLNNTIQSPHAAYSQQTELDNIKNEAGKCKQELIDFVSQNKWDFHSLPDNNN